MGLRLNPAFLACGRKGVPGDVVHKCKKKINYGGIMALEIRNISVLTGSTAESFVRAADE